MKSIKFRRPKHYTYPEILQKTTDVRRRYNCSKADSNKGVTTLNVKLQPTENSPVYTVQLRAKIGLKRVDVFVINPQLKYVVDGKLVPHVYRDHSLCLFYPRYQEWDYKASWAETIIPWTSLWLYYY